MKLGNQISALLNVTSDDGSGESIGSGHESFIHEVKSCLPHEQSGYVIANSTEVETRSAVSPRGCAL